MFYGRIKYAHRFQQWKLNIIKYLCKRTSKMSFLLQVPLGNFFNIYVWRCVCIELLKRFYKSTERLICVCVKVVSFLEYSFWNDSIYNFTIILETSYIILKRILFFDFPTKLFLFSLLVSTSSKSLYTC